MSIDSILDSALIEWGALNLTGWPTYEEAREAVWVLAQYCITKWMPLDKYTQEELFTQFNKYIDL